MNNSLVFFVTGAAGFVGREICELLTSLSYQVHAITRSADVELERFGVKLWRGDLWDKDLLTEAVSGANVVIHCAGNAKFGNGTSYHKENYELTEYLLSVVSNCSIKTRFVYVSTIGAVDRASSDRCEEELTETSEAFPSSDYGRSKLQAEAIVKSCGLPYSIIRPTMVVGSNMRIDSHFSNFARQALLRTWVSRLGWPGKFSVVSVRDLANAILIVATDKRAIDETFFCAGEVISITDFFEQCNPNVVRMPLGWIPYLARSLIKLTPFSLKAMLLPALTASDAKLRGLGWKPDNSAKKALEDVIRRERARLDPNVSPGGVTVVTGAASGLGRALAIYLSSRRDKLLLIDKNQPALEVLTSQLQNSDACVVDLAQEEEIEALMNSATWQHAPITELFACAGIGLRGRMQDISMDGHRKMLSINLLARLALGQNLIDRMKKHYFGRVVMISSSSAFQPLPYMATYAGSNSALLSIGEAWGFEVMDDGIQIMTVCPGGMQTNFQKNGGVKEITGEKLMLPEEVVKKIFRGLRQQKHTIIVSFRALAMSLMARILPRALSVRLWGLLMERMR